MTGRVAVIGGGIGGAAAALHLARHGADVVLIERSDRLGGLVMSLEVGGTPVERFYHHVFPHEREVLGLIDDLGLGTRLEWRRSSVGMLTGGRVWPFTSPLDLLRFGPLPPADRVRTGVGALRSMRWKDWEVLDRVTAEAWLTGLMGRTGYERVWEPLLRAKFGAAAPRVPAAWMLGRFQQRAAARSHGVERLGYLRGGFRQLFDALEAELLRHGVKLQLDTGATAIELDPAGRTAGVATDTGPVEADAVLYAGTLPGLAPLVPAGRRDDRWSAIEGMGAMAVVVELRRAVTDTYWVNVCDPELPLTAYIEHTNLVPAGDYGGRRLAYLARYFTADDPIATADVDAEARRWVDALAGGGLPGFRAADVVALHPARTLYAAPLLELGNMARIPPVRSHIPGLYVSTTAQIYPQDRGMSEGIRLGVEAAGHLLADLTGSRAPRPASPRATGATGWTCPVCGGPRCTAMFPVVSGATEGGVDADAFRPSSDRYGRTAGVIVACDRCGHGTLDRYPAAAEVARAYEGAADPVSLREGPGQEATAERALARIGAVAAPGRLLDVGCWTGSLVAVAARRGWDAAGVEPSSWAAGLARARGLDVRHGGLDDVDAAPGSLRAVCFGDVLEHLADPAAAVERAHQLLDFGGVLYVTVPDAGSRTARLLGRRWWSVLPMHLQYFTRPSMTALLHARGFRVVHAGRHAKTFSARYYAERLGGYGPRVAALSVAALRAAGLDGRLVSPDLGDRLEIVAVGR